jgi:hypothetical protein
VQVLYTRPYADEGPAMRELHAFAAAQGLKLRGLHHEIYLNDFRRTAPEKLKRTSGSRLLNRYITRNFYLR